MEKEATQKQAILVPLPVELHVQLKRRAKEERRSMAGQAVIAIEEHLRQQGGAP